MVIAVCTDSGEDYEAIRSGIKSYGEQKKYLLIPRKFSGPEYQTGQMSYWYPITIFALDDIMNQELSIIARGLSKASQFVWIGQDKRFGMAAYRSGIAYTFLRPITEAEIWNSLDRCFERLAKTGRLSPWEDKRSGYKEWMFPEPPEHVIGGR